MRHHSICGIIRMRFFSVIFSVLLLFSFQSQAAQQWKTISHSYAHRAEGTLIEYKGEVFMFNGFTNGLQIEKKIEKYNYQANKWTLIGNTFSSDKEPTAVTHNGAILDGDDVWLIGGRIGPHPGKVSNQVWIYNIATKKMRQGPTLPATFGGGGAALVNGKIHVIGGFDAQARCDVATHWVYDLTKPNLGWQNYTNRSPMPLARNHFGTTTFSGKIYVIGGQHGHDTCAKLAKTAVDVKYVHAYDTNTDTWERLADLPIKLSHTEPSTFVYKGRIYTVGAQLFSDKVLSYDLAGNKWKEHTELKLPENLIAPGSRIYNNKLYTFGGGGPLVTNQITDTKVISLDDTPIDPPPVDDEPSTKYTQSGNKVVIVSANFSANKAGNSHNWSKKNNVQPAGMISLPNIQKLYSASNLSNSPKLSYKTRFTKPGLYYIWVRGLGDAKNGEGKDDSLHVGLNGKVQTGSDKLDGYTPVWSWRNSTRDGAVATLNIPSVGVHEINVWMREDGLAFNKLILTSDKNYKPNGIGPDPTLTGTSSSNQKPIVNAGKNTEVDVGQALLLQGSIADDGLPNGTLTSEWRKISGPGTVTFAYANKPISEVTFSKPGKYILTLEASDGELTDSSNIEVVVKEGNMPQPNPANLVIDPLDAKFPDTIVGANTTLIISFKNSGDETLTVSQVSVGGDQSSNFYTALSVGTEIEGGKELQVEIEFSPSSLGAKNAVLTISHNGTGALDLISLQGLAIKRPDNPGGSDRQVIYRINAGGSQIPLTNTLPWQSDDKNNPSGFVTLPSSIYARNVPVKVVPNTLPDYAVEKLFQSERWSGNKSQGLAWAFPVISGEYEVRLYFAEIYPGAFANGARTFNILIENQLKESKLDTFKQVGSTTAMMRSFIVDSDMELNIKLQHQVENPAIKAIEILYCPSTCAGGTDPVNKKPIVNVGQDTTVVISDSLTLNGTASDDQLPIATLTYQWRKVSGPGTATFADTSNPATTVTFNAVGTYVLAIKVSDSELFGEDRLTVIVRSDSTTGDDDVLTEVDGVLSIEAEHFTHKTSTATHSWVKNTATTASNQAFMVTTPNNAKIQHTSGSGPMLAYKVFFNISGNKKIWIRGLGDTNANGEGKSDSLHVGLNAKAVGSADKIDLFPSNWSWSNHTRDKSPAVISIPKPGEYTINIWMREDGLKVDKILLLSDHSRTPNGFGPQESE